MSQKKALSAMGIGVTSLLTIMAVLLLTSFAVLSLVSARSDLRLSERAAQAATDFYAADSEAELWYMQLDADLLSASGDALEQTLASQGYAVEPHEDGLKVSEHFRINDTKNLYVEILVDTAQAPSTKILRWQSVAEYSESN